jgi:ElaB protein
VVEKVSDAAHAARAQVEERGAEIIDQAKQKASQVYDQANKTLNEQYEKAMDYGRDHPGKTVLIAFGVGVGVGLLVASSFNAPYSRRRRIVEPVMNALSTLAYDLFR